MTINSLEYFLQSQYIILSKEKDLGSDTYYLLCKEGMTVRSSSRIGMPIGKICDLLSVYLCVPILFQFIDPRPRTPSGHFIGILLPTQGPVQACSSMGLCVTDSRPSWACSSMGLCVTDSRPLGVSGGGPFSSPTKCWSREGREKGLGLYLGLHRGSLLGLETRPYQVSSRNAMLVAHLGDVKEQLPCTH